MIIVYYGGAIHIEKVRKKDKMSWCLAKKIAQHVIFRWCIIWLMNVSMSEEKIDRDRQIL